MKVWITRYALTDGILDTDAKVCFDADATGNMISCDRGYFHGDGRDWHRTKEAALVRAEKMRQKKIASLKKQIEKLERMKFE